MKIHIRDIRLRNNAGMNFPVCQAGAELLDMDKAHWPTVGVRDNPTCKHCIRLFAKRYSWAVPRPRKETTS